MTKKFMQVAIGCSMFLPLFSCGSHLYGKINFELNGGSFKDTSFSTTYLEGPSGTPVLVDIPDPVKEGYYFVGWREKAKDGSYRTINKRLGEDGKSYYYYPYVEDTFYAYFEPLVTIRFDLTKGSDKNATLVAPLLDAASFDADTGMLNGYASKQISSVDYLPTASAEGQHLTFNYWYTEYPLISQVDENMQKHYSLDTNGTKGEYRFDRSFGTDYMSFPITTGNDFTLYASWSEDPTITVHYNVPGINNSVFQAKDNISAELTELMKSTLGIDYSIVDTKKYYYKNEDGTVDLRFAGFYTDPAFKEQFSLSSPIYDLDFDVYLKWEESIDVTLDYDNGNPSEVIKGYYENDVLGLEFLKNHTPTKANASFVSYQLDGADFNFERQPLPNHDITLKAVYDDYPFLILKYDYPSSYTDLKLEDKKIALEPTTELASKLSSFKDDVINDAKTAEHHLECGSFYVLDGMIHTSMIFERMPDEDLTVYLEINYKSEINFKTYANVSSGYEVQAVKIDPIYYGVSDPSVTLSSLPAAVFDSLTIGTDKYLLDDLYTDEALTSVAIFPLAQSPSHINPSIFTLYRKMTKSIQLRFVEAAGSTTIDYMDVIPGKSLATYSSELTALLGSYTRLYIIDGGTERTLSTIMPTSSMDVYVVR